MKNYTEECMAKETFELTEDFLGKDMCPEGHWLQVYMVIRYVVDHDSFDYDYGERVGCSERVTSIGDIEPWITAVELYHESNPSVPQEISDSYADEYRSEAQRYLKTSEGCTLVERVVDSDLRRNT